MSGRSLRLSRQIRETEEEVKKLNREADKLGRTRVPTQEYAELDRGLKKAKESLDRAVAAKREFSGEKLVHTQEYRELDALIKETAASLEKLYDSQKKMDETGVRHNSSRWKNTQYGIEQLEKHMAYYRADLQDTIDRHRDLEESSAWKKVKEDVRQAGMEFNRCKKSAQELAESGRAFTSGYDTEAYRKKTAEIERANEKLREYDARMSEIREKEDRLGRSVSGLGTIASKAFGTVGKVLKGADNALTRLGATAKKVFRKLHADTKKQNSFLATMKSRLKGITLSLLVFNWITRAFNSMVSGIKEGFQNLIRYSEDYNRSISALVSANSQLKNSLGAAFRPIVELAVPCLIRLISYATKAANTVAQLFAVLSGKSTWTRAKEVNEDYRETLDGVKDSAEEAEKALEGYLSPIDTIHKYRVDEKTDSKTEPGGNAGDLFEEVPVEKNIREFAEKLREILSRMFEPLEKAWNREGKFVMDSWKEALKSVGSLVKTIGKDFLTVWNQERTIQALADILHIVGDVGLAVRNLASGFEDAWKKNDTGLHILENIRNIFAAIIANVRSAADYTVEWSKNLNFSPLLEAFERLTASLEPVVKSVTGILTDFYEKVLLPLGKWTIEKGLPELLDIFTAFNERVDWNALRNRLSDFWEHLEPFAETVGEGLIIFIGKCADALADFVESGAFDSFLTKLENWMDNVEPEDVAKALELIAGALISLKLAIMGFNIISTGFGFITKLFDLLEKVKGGAIAGGLTKIGGAIAGWAPHIAVAAAILGVIGKIKKAVSERLDTKNFNLFDWIVETLKLARQGIKNELEGLKINLELWWQDFWLSDKIWQFGQWWDEKVSPWFTKEKWSGILKNIKESFSDVWNRTVGQWKRNIMNWWNENVAPWFTVEKWKSVLGGIISSFRGIFSEVVSIVSEKMGAAFDKVAGWVSRIKELIKGIFGRVSNTIGKIGSGISGLFSGGSSRSLLSQVKAAGYTRIPVPAYATGTVIPPSMSRHLAILGDNNREAEVVSPLSTMEKAMENVLARRGNGGGTYQFVAQVERKTLFNEFIKEAKLRQMATGKNPLDLA